MEKEYSAMAKNVLYGGAITEQLLPDRRTHPFSMKCHRFAHCHTLFGPALVIFMNPEVSASEIFNTSVITVQFIASISPHAVLHTLVHF